MDGHHFPDGAKDLPGTFVPTPSILVTVPEDRLTFGGETDDMSWRETTANESGTAL